MSIDYEMRIDFSQFRAAIEAAVPIALAKGADHVRGIAAGRAPVQTSHLKNSGGVTVHGSGIDCVADVKFPGPYAAYINRGRRWDGSHVIRNHPGGGMAPGYLSVTMVDQREAVLQIIADTIAQLS